MPEACSPVPTGSTAKDARYAALSDAIVASVPVLRALPGISDPWVRLETANLLNNFADHLRTLALSLRQP